MIIKVANLPIIVQVTGPHPNVGPPLRHMTNKSMDSC